MDRRDFISQTALASLALCVAACGAGSDATGPALSSGATIKVSDYPALANVNGIATFNLSGTPVAVVKTGTDTFIALSRVCPHQGATVGSTGSGFLCPEHGARFSITGTWQGGERTSNMRSIATTYNAATGELKLG